MNILISDEFRDCSNKGADWSNRTWADNAIRVASCNRNPTTGWCKWIFIWRSSTCYVWCWWQLPSKIPQCTLKPTNNLGNIRIPVYACFHNGVYLIYLQLFNIRIPHQQKFVSENEYLKIVMDEEESNKKDFIHIWLNPIVNECQYCGHFKYNQYT